MREDAEVKELVLLGGGYGCREVIELIDDINERSLQYKVIAILDDNPELQGKEVCGIPVEGKLCDVGSYPDAQFVFCIGTKDSRKARRIIIEGLGLEKERFVTLIHPSAKIYKSASLGNGCIVYYGSAVYGGSRIGDFCSIATNTVIGTDTRIGDYVLIASGSVILNRVSVGEAAYIASGVSINDDVIIEKHAVVGIGAVVLKKVGEDQFAFGNPARIMLSMEKIGQVSEG